MAITDINRQHKNLEIKGNSTRIRHNIKRILGPWLFLVPLVILSSIVVIGPALSAFYYSLTKWSGFNVPVFIGLKNFRELLSDPLFKIAIVNNFKWLAYSITIPMLMGLICAWLVSMVRNQIVQMIYRIAYFLPYVLSSVVVTGLWLIIFNPLNGIGKILGSYPFLAWANISFLGDKNLLMWSLAFVGGWASWGFNLVVLLAAMQSIDPELNEMAEMEGANRLQILFYITIPSIRFTFAYLFLLIAMGSFQVFDYVYLIIPVGGGPGNSAYNIATLTYTNIFRFFRVGYGTAVGLSSAFFGIIFIIIYVYIVNRNMEA